MALSAGAALHEVRFSCRVPEADRVYLLGDFNNWTVSDDARMTRENGLWHRTLELEEGEHAYVFQAEGERIDGDGRRLDWKASRELHTPRKPPRSLLRIPDDLETYHARQRPARETDQGIDVPLFYERYPEDQAAYRFGSRPYRPLMTAPPRGDWKLPELIGDTPLYGTVRFGDRDILVIVDRQNADDPYYNRLHVDLNQNGDLTDEDPIPGTVRARENQMRFECTFPSVDIEMASGEHRLPFSLAFDLIGTMLPPEIAAEFGRDRRSPLMLSVAPNCAYLGEVEIDGTAYRIALADATGNGFFDDVGQLQAHVRGMPGRVYTQGDIFHITSNDRAGSTDGMLLGNSLTVGDRLFGVQVDIPGGRLLLEPLAEGYGTLEWTAPMQTVSLVSTEEDRAAMLYQVGERAPVPAGTWQVLDYRLMKSDEWGDTWLLWGRGTTDTPPVAVRAQESVPLAIGEPLQASVSISESALQHAVVSNSLRMSFQILGSGKESIVNIQHISGTNTQHKMARRGSNRPEAPTFQIIKPDGERVYSGSFEYG